MQNSQALEFPKVLALAAAEARSPQTATALENLRPLATPEEVTTELAVLKQMLELLDFQGDPPLTGLHGLDAELEILRLPGGFLTGEQLLQLLEPLTVAEEVKVFLEPFIDQYSLLLPVAEKIVSFSRELKQLRRMVGPEGEILDSASRELAAIRTRILKRQRELDKQLQQTARELAQKGVAREAVVTRRGGRDVIPVKENFRGRLPGVVVDRSDSGATVFMEPAFALEAQAEILHLHAQEQQEINRLLRSYSETLRNRLPELEATLAALHRLDFLAAKARYGRRLEGCVPLVVTKMELVLKEARHPLLLEKGPVVPLTLALGEKGDRILLVSGPNAGGKTVALKTVGLLSLMARCALPVPAATGTKIPFFREVFTDIGDEQSLENDLSTFSSHLLRLLAMVENFQGRHLFLIDEMGSGTDPAEGAALAKAILERLLQGPGLVLVTTHLGDLKAFAHDTPGIRNGSMAFDEEHIAPTYRFIPDLPGSSYALEIAQRLKAPKVIIDRSRYFLGSERKSLEKLISSLRRKIRENERLETQLAARTTELEALTAEYRAKIKAARKESRHLKQQALAEARRIMEGANKAIENAVREIRSHKADKTVVSRHRQELKGHREKLEQRLHQLERKKEPTATQVKPGDRVRVEEITRDLEVLSVDPERGRFVAQAGFLKLTFSLEQIIKILPPEKHSAGSTGAVPGVEALPLTLDLRGLTVDEALARVDSYLDSCLLHDLRDVTILHGKGTGALREAIHEYLKRQDFVRSFRLGRLEEGGAGVTRVQLGSG